METHRPPLEGQQEDLFALEVYTPTTLPEQYTTPEGKVEAFLENHAELFTLTDERWDRVHDSEREFFSEARRVGEMVKNGKIPLPTLNREQRRTAIKQYGRLAKDPAATMAMIAGQGSAMLRLHLQELKNLEDYSSYREASTIFNEHVREDREELNKGIKEFLEDATEHASTENEQTTIGLIMPFAQRSLGMSFLYEDAYFSNGCIVAAVGRLLAEDPACIRPLIAELKAEAARSESGTKRHGALLETLAAYAGDYPKDNVLTNALMMTTPSEKDVAPDFIKEIHTGTGNRKELIIAKSVMKSMIEVGSDVFGIDEDEFLAAYTNRFDKWPAELKKALNVFGLNRAASEVSDLRQMLRPHFDAARSLNYRAPNPLALNKEGKLVPQTKRAKQRNSEKNKGASYMGRKRGKAAISGLVEIEESAEIEKAPISRFAVMRQHGASERGITRYRLEYTTSVKELFDISNLSTCIDKHPGDKGIEQMLTDAIEHLRVEPRDPRFTKSGDGLHYRLPDDPLSARARNARRFSPRGFPGVKHNSTASQLRLIYDVLQLPDENNQQQETLVVYGVIPRQDLANDKNYNKLPGRRWR